MDSYHDDREAVYAAQARLGYDVVAACEYNIPISEFNPLEIERIELELTGENDGKSWHWILAMKDGTWAYLTGGCDYTGWDCQSGAEAYPAATRDEALALVDEHHRAVFVDMLAKGEAIRQAPDGSF